MRSMRRRCSSGLLGVQSHQILLVSSFCLSVLRNEGRLSQLRSQKCQMIDWKERGHKKGCKIQQMLNEMNAAQDAKRPERPPADRCTGCNVKFNED